MKRKTNILTKAGVLLIAATMLLSALPAVLADTIEADNQGPFAQAKDYGVEYQPGSIYGAAKLNTGEGTFDDGALGFGADNWISYNDGYTENGLGLTAAGTITMMIELTAAELTGYYGQTITEITASIGCDVYGTEPAIPFDLWITTSLPDAATLYTAGPTPVLSGTTNPAIVWQTFTLPTAWTIPASGSVFVGFNFVNTGVEHPCGIDETTTTPMPRAGYVTYDGLGSWDNLVNIGFPGVWGIDVGVSAGGGPGPGEECIEDACDFDIYGFSPEFMAMANYDPVLDAYYWNSLPKTLEVSIANRGEIGINELKLLADVYEKICGPTTEIWCDEKYDIQLFDTSPTYPYTFEDWVIEDDLDGDSWVLQGGPDNRWLTNNQAWRCTAGEDRSFGDDSDVYLGKNDNPLAGNMFDNLTTPGFDISGAACATFSFSHWCEGEYTTDDDGNIVPVDFGTMAYSINGGVDWVDVDISDFLAYDTNGEWVDVALKFINTAIDADDADYMHPYATICDECAPDEDDILVEVDFPVDAELQVKFIWDKDPCLQFEGWYIDNVCVTRTEDYELELVHQTHIIMEVPPCEEEVTWINVDFPIDWDPEPDTWYEIWICGQVFSPSGCEIDLTNNCFKTQFKIVDIHDMACVGMELISPADGTGTPDDDVTVNVTVKNLGSFTESSVPVELLVGNMVVDEVMNEDFETDPSGKFDAYYFIGGSGDVPFRWTSGDPSISNIYTNDPCQARSKNPGSEALICAEEGTMPYLMEDTACLLVIPETIDLDRNDNGVKDYGDPASATFVFDAKWSMDYVTAIGSMAWIGINMLDGPAAGYTLFLTFGAEAYPYYANDWQHNDIDLYDLLDDVTDYWYTQYGWVYDDIPEVQIGWVVVADGYGIDFLAGDANGGCSNVYNPIPWTGFMVDRVQLRIVNAEESSLEVVTTATTGSLAPGAEETLQMTWSTTELCHHALVANVNADDDINPSNDRCFEEVYIIDEEKCLSGGTEDLTSGGDCLWHACTNRENGDDYFAWTGINEEHWGHYVNNMDEGLVSQSINITGFADEGVAINFTTYYEFESGDFGEVYVQSGGEWHVLQVGGSTKFLGSSGGGFLDVTAFVPEEYCSDYIKIKFRMYSDDEFVSEGWFVDDIYVVDVTNDGVDSGTLADIWYACGTGYTWPTPGPGQMNEADASSYINIAAETTSDFVAGACWYDGGWLGLTYDGNLYDIATDGTQTLRASTSLTSLSGLCNHAGTLYLTDAANLYEVDPDTGATTLKGAHGGGSSTMIGIASDDTTIFGIDIGTDSSWTIDPATGAATLIGSTGYGMGYAQDTSCDKATGDVYHAVYISGGEAYLTKLNQGTGSLDHVSTFPLVEVVGFAIPSSGAGALNLTFGPVIPALMWLDMDGDPAMPHGELEDFERGTVDPWTCEASIGGNYWKFSQDVATLPNAAGPYDESLIDPCVNGWHVIEGYPASGTGLNNAKWFEVDLSDPNLQFAKLEFVMDYDLAKENIFVEFSPDWAPGEDMEEATWITYFCHTPGDMYGDNTGDWVGINDIVGDDRFILEEYLGQVVYVRFRMVTDGNGAAVGEGWAIDGLGLSVKRYDDGGPPDDDEDPVTSIFFNGDTGTVTLVAVDYPLNKNSGIAGTFYKIDGGAQTTYTVPFDIGEGQHTVEYWSEDNAGNVETHKTASYTVDSTPPTVELTSPEVGGIYFLGNKLFNLGTTTICIGKVPIVADAADAGSGVARVLFDVNGDTGYDDAAPYAYTFKGMVFGSLTIEATAIDNNGLMSSPDSMTVTCFSLGLL